MRIGLNAHLMSFGTSYRGAGISRYIKNLILHLRRVEEGPEYIVFLGDRRTPPEFEPGPRFRLRFSRLPTVRPAVRVLWEQLVLPAELARWGVGLVHCLGFARPLVCPARSVLTIYDLSFMVTPQAHGPVNRLYLRAITPFSAARADAVIAISEHTKKDAVRLLNIPEDKVRVVYPGLEEDFSPLADRQRLEAFRRQRGLPDRFILFCGTLEPRKNIEGLVRAYAALRRRGATHHQLVIAGAKGWRWEGIFAEVRRLGLEGEVRYAGFIPADEQPLWYNCADLFVYPSLYEGFGLPPLEAMACGVPVVCSNAASLPEVVGDAGWLVDPRDEGAWAAAIERTLSDEGLRRTMVQRGLARARQFSWLQAARRTVEIYRAVQGAPGAS